MRSIDLLVSNSALGLPRRLRVRLSLGAQHRPLPAAGDRAHRLHHALLEVALQPGEVALADAVPLHPRGDVATVARVPAAVRHLVAAEVPEGELGAE
jgi:hypothetical protein